MNILLCGVGGQGIILASQVLGEACIRAGKHVVISEIHGMAQRGGSVYTFVRIDEGDAPIPPEGSVEVALSFERVELLRYLNYTSQKTTAIVNTGKIPPIGTTLAKKEYPDIEQVIGALQKSVGHVFYFDAERIARESGSKQALNSVMLGAFASVVSIIPKDTLLEVLISKVPEKAREINKRAFEGGYKICARTEA
jgi:indolepyruvate ferredoxin oxidoreductase beta subunit